MTDYSATARRTDKTFRRTGQLMTLTLKQPGTYAGGAKIPGVPVIKQAWGVETAVTLRDLGVGVINGTLIKSGDRKVLMSAFDDGGAALPEPKVDDLVLAGGVTYAIKNIEKIAPAGAVVMWQLVARI